MKGHTLDQFAVLHFNIQKEQRNYQIMLQPGAPFDEIQAVLDEFKESFVALQENYKEQEAKQKSEQEKEAVPVEAELVA